MSCESDLLARFDQAVQNFEFPTWRCGEEGVIVGAARALGFTSSSGVGWVFEQVEYSGDEGVIQCTAFCIATFPVSTWLASGDGAFVSSKSLHDRQTGKWNVQFGELQVTSRDRTFSVPLDRDDLVAGGYLEAGAEAPTREAVLFKVCDTLPREWLFSGPDHLKETFEMPDDARLLFIVEDWEHPGLEDAYGDPSFKASALPDIVAMVRALCDGDPAVKLSGTPNTSWRARWPRHGQR